MCFGSFDELVTDALSKVDKTNLIWATTLIFSFDDVTDYLVANNHAFQKGTRVRVSNELINVILYKCAAIDLVLYSCSSENHLIGSQCTCFVSQDIINYA